MKALRVTALSILFLLGVACVAWYFVLGDSPDDSEKNESSGVLLTDTAPLGKLSVLSDGTLAAGNSRGEVKFFRPGEPVRTVSVSKTSISAPVAEFGGVCYVGDEGGMFAAFTPDRGVLWTFKAGNQITGGAAMDSDGLVWFGSHDQTLYALDASGKLVHEVACNGQINGSPVFDGTFVYLGSCDGRLRKIDVRTGEVVQSLDFESYIPETPVLADGVLYVLTHGGDLVAVNADSFEELYKVATGFSFFSSPFVTDRYLYLADANGLIHVYARANGAYETDLASPDKLNPIGAGSGRGVYTTSLRGRLSFYEEGKWREHVLAEFPSDFKSGVTASGDVLSVPDEYGNLFYARRKDSEP